LGADQRSAIKGSSSRKGRGEGGGKKRRILIVNGKSQRDDNNTKRTWKERIMRPKMRKSVLRKRHMLVQVA